MSNPNHEQCVQFSTYFNGCILYFVNIKNIVKRKEIFDPDFVYVEYDCCKLNIDPSWFSKKSSDPIG